MREQEIPADTVTCTRCGWVSYAVTREHAEQHVARHNAMRLEHPENEKFWPTPTSLDRYRCLGCGGWGPYRPARPGAARRGRPSTPLSWTRSEKGPRIAPGALSDSGAGCSYDEDRASLESGIGWGKSHSHSGHVLGSLQELSVIEASQALAALWRHRKQVRPGLRAEILGSAEA